MRLIAVIDQAAVVSRILHHLGLPDEIPHPAAARASPDPLAGEPNRRQLPGVGFYPVSFTPASSNYANQRCQGVTMVVTSREQLRPVRRGIETAPALHRLYRTDYRVDQAAGLLGAHGQLHQGGRRPVGHRKRLVECRDGMAADAGEVHCSTGEG